MTTKSISRLSLIVFSSKKNTALIWQDFFSYCFLLEFFFFTKTFLTLAQHQSIKNSQQNRTGFRKQFLVQILLTRAECVTMYPYNIGLLPPSFSSLSKDTQWKICSAKTFKFLKFKSCSLGQDLNAILDQKKSLYKSWGGVSSRVRHSWIP